MKSLNQYINEKLKVSKKQYNYCPQTKEELKELVKRLIEERGNAGDFNDIDVSNITDMSGLFKFTEFNGDISGWDVSNVTDMHSMFYCCDKFKGKCLERWNVSNVTNMNRMFYDCENLDCNLSNWDVSNVKDMYYMFFYCKLFEGKGLENWDVSNVTDMRKMFDTCNNLDCNLSNWDVSNVTKNLWMFDNCHLKDEYKPKFR